MTTVYAVAAFLLPVMVVLVVAGTISTRALIQRLKAVHPERYKALGEPGLFNYSRESQRALRLFILDREDRDLNDPALSRMTARARVLYVGCIGCTIYVLGSAVAMSLGIHGL